MYRQFFSPMVIVFFLITGSQAALADCPPPSARDAQRLLDTARQLHAADSALTGQLFREPLVALISGSRSGSVEAVSISDFFMVFENVRFTRRIMNRILDQSLTEVTRERLLELRRRTYPYLAFHNCQAAEPNTGSVTSCRTQGARSGVSDSADRLGEGLDGLVRQGPTGAVFTRVTFPGPAWENAWRDPTGLVWGNTIDEPFSRRSTQETAAEYCHTQGGRLPTAREAALVASAMGARGVRNANEGLSPHPNSGQRAEGERMARDGYDRAFLTSTDAFYYSERGFVQEVIPNFGPHVFWTSDTRTIQRTGYTYQTGFSERDAVLVYVDLSQRNILRTIRCVRRMPTE